MCFRSNNHCPNLFHYLNWVHNKCLFSNLKAVIFIMLKENSQAQNCFHTRRDKQMNVFFFCFCRWDAPKLFRLMDRQRLTVRVSHWADAFWTWFWLCIKLNIHQRQTHWKCVECVFHLSQTQCKTRGMTSTVSVSLVKRKIL